MAPDIMNAMLRSWSAHASACAWEEPQKTKSFLALREDVEELRRAWRQQGLRSHHRIALHGLPPYESWVCLLAAAYEQCTIAPLPGRLREEQLTVYFEQVDFHYWIGSSLAPVPGLKPLAKPKAQGDGPSLGGGDRALSALRAIDLETRWEENAPYLLIYSSGSSGRPKAVQHSLAALIASAQATLDFYEVPTHSSWLLSLELSHIGGFQIALRSWIGGLRCCAGFATTEIRDAVALFHPHYLSLVPTQLGRLLDDGEARSLLRRARAILIGGAGCPDDLRSEAASEHLPLSITYGSSEAASQVAAHLPGHYPETESDVGELLPIWEGQVREGRLALRGAALCQGFWIEGSFHPLDASEGFFLSSDRAALEGRRLLIFGRSDDVFQVGGENVSPGEIIAALSPLRAPGDWIVLAQNDADYGHVPILIYRSDKAPPARARIDALLRSLAGIKRPRAVYWHRSDDSSKPSKNFYAELLRAARDLETAW